MAATFSKSPAGPANETASPQSVGPGRLGQCTASRAERGCKLDRLNRSSFAGTGLPRGNVRNGREKSCQAEIFSSSVLSFWRLSALLHVLFVF